MSLRQKLKFYKLEKVKLNLALTAANSIESILYDYARSIYIYIF